MSSTPESDRPARLALDLARPRLEVDRSATIDAVDEQVAMALHRRPGVAMVASTGRLSDVSGDLRRAVLLALAEEPLAVVCDLSGVADGNDADARSLMAAAGQQVRNWPAVPVAMACPGAALRRRLRQQPMSEHVLLSTTMRQALAAVGRVVPPPTARRQLAPQATANRLARDFVSRTCLDWGLAQGIASACLVVSELVTDGLRHAVTDLDLGLARHGGLLRLSLRSPGVGSASTAISDEDSVGGRGLALVDACSRAWGVLPTADGGKVGWAVLDVTS
jgi:hypothetical protein